MKTNPGGQIELHHVIGRDLLIKQLWEALASQSVRVNSERRIGKTTVLRKMVAITPPAWFAVYLDLEAAHTADEFALLTYQQIQKFLTDRRKQTNRVHKWLADRGIKVLGVLELEKQPQAWKDLLTRAVEDLIAEQKPNRLVFFWDEMPYMLDNIRRRNGEAVAMQVLDTLRTLRHTHPEFRMVLTGSIGLHHVLKGLREENPGNQPLNDLFSFEVPPLDPPYGAELALKLIQGEQLPGRDPQRAAERIAELADHVPFYIHHIVRGLKFSGRPAELTDIEDMVAQQLVDANDPWQLHHYRERIDQYYPDDIDWALIVLDELALVSQPLAPAELLERLKTHGPYDDRGKLLKILRLLDLDHYLKKTIEGRFEFRFPLIKRWWKLAQGL